MNLRSIAALILHLALAAHLALLSLDHLLDHVAADLTGVLAGQIAVVALIQGDAQFVGDFMRPSILKETTPASMI